MARTATIFRVLLVAPTDIKEEVNIVKNAISMWNAAHSIEMELMLELVSWDTHGRPELGNRPQQIKNEQLLSDCDALIGVFWTMIEEETKVYKAGSVEEIEFFIKSKKPSMTYFSKRAIALDEVNMEVYNKLLAHL